MNLGIKRLPADRLRTSQRVSGRLTVKLSNELSKPSEHDRLRGKT